MFSPIDSPIKKENGFRQIFNVFRPSGNPDRRQTKTNYDTETIEQLSQAHRSDL